MGTMKAVQVICALMAGVALALLGEDISDADKKFTKDILVKDLVRMPISQVTWVYDATPGTTRKDKYLDPNMGKNWRRVLLSDSL